MKKQVFALLALVTTLVGAGLQGSDTCYNSCGFGGLGLCEGNFYVGGFAGVNFLQQIKAQDSKAKFKTGFAAGLALGYEFENNIRLEGEFAYRRNALKSFAHHHISTDSHGKDRFTVETYTAMGNLLYDFDLCSDWVPYVGFGLGYAWNKARIDEHCANNNFHWHKTVGRFAYQAIAGVGYKVYCDTDLGLEYRFLHAKSNVKDHAIAVSLRRGF